MSKNEIHSFRHLTRRSDDFDDTIAQHSIFLIESGRSAGPWKYH